VVTLHVPVATHNDVGVVIICVLSASFEEQDALSRVARQILRHKRSRRSTSYDHVIKTIVVGVVVVHNNPNDHKTEHNNNSQTQDNERPPLT
jgi:hypothetical protein